MILNLKLSISGDDKDSPILPSTSPASKSRLSFSVDSLLRKKIQVEDDELIDDEVDEEDDLEESDHDLPEDLSSNNNEVENPAKNGQESLKDLPKLAMPTPLMPNSMAALIRPQPHFLAAGIAAMAAAALANNSNQNNPTSTSSGSTSNTSSSPFASVANLAASSGSNPGVNPGVNGSTAPWPHGPPPGIHGPPPLGFPFGLPGLRPHFFTTGK